MNGADLLMIGGDSKLQCDLEARRNALRALQIFNLQKFKLLRPIRIVKGFYDLEVTCTFWEFSKRQNDPRARPILSELSTLFIAIPPPRALIPNTSLMASGPGAAPSRRRS